MKKTDRTRWDALAEELAEPAEAPAKRPRAQYAAPEWPVAAVVALPEARGRPPQPVATTVLVIVDGVVVSQALEASWGITEQLRAGTPRVTGSFRVVTNDPVTLARKLRSGGVSICARYGDEETRLMVYVTTTSIQGSRAGGMDSMTVFFAGTQEWVDL